MLEWKEQTIRVARTPEGDRIEMHADAKETGLALQAYWHDGGCSTSWVANIIEAQKRAEEMIAHHRADAANRAAERKRRAAKQFEDLI